jgi:hypothetical protein
LPNIAEIKEVKNLNNGKFFPQVFKMATIFKMAENWFFDHNSVNFEHFCVLFYDSLNHGTELCILVGHISQKKSFLSDLRSHLISNMAAENKSSIT